MRRWAFPSREHCEANLPVTPSVTPQARWACFRWVLLGTAGVSPAVLRASRAQNHWRLRRQCRQYSTARGLERHVMISVKLPDGSTRELKDGASSADLAAAIGAGLAKAAVAAKVDGKVVDLALPLPNNAQVQILTKKDKEALEVLRHSSAHLMADAILRIFPKAQLTIGPVVDDGFYYDIYLPEGKISTDDFPRIEAEMLRVAEEGKPFQRCVSSYDEADEHFARYRAIDGGHNKFKRELVTGIRE